MQIHVLSNSQIKLVLSPATAQGLFLKTKSMLVVSLHGIRLHTLMGLYPQEHVLGNDLEADVDVYAPAKAGTELPFIDYSIIQQIVQEIFAREEQLIESFVHEIHARLKKQFPVAEKVKVTVRKLHPPMAGDIRYAQVCFED